MLFYWYQGDFFDFEAYVLKSLVLISFLTIIIVQKTVVVVLPLLRLLS